jgi:CubicO group peptidase (beta-lactamase class C family)
MYDILAYLPEILVKRSFTSYVEEHIFKPLNMSSSRYSVVKAEKGLLVDGFTQNGQDLKLGMDGFQKPIIPFFARPGNEYDFAGCGGVLASTRDLVSFF